MQLHILMYSWDERESVYATRCWVWYVNSISYGQLLVRWSYVFPTESRMLFRLTWCITEKVSFSYLRLHLLNHFGKERRTACRRWPLSLSIRLLRIMFIFGVIVYAIERDSPSDSNRNGNTKLNDWSACVVFMVHRPGIIELTGKPYHRKIVYIRKS